MVHHSKDIVRCGHNQCVCLTKKNWRSTSNPKCHMMFSRNKMNLNQHLHFTLKCHLNVTYLVVHVVTISNVSIDKSFSFLHKSYYVSILNCTCPLMCHFSGCKFLRVICQTLAKNFVKNHNVSSRKPGRKLDPM